jgi:osmoprotectant transport system permease protein
MLLLGRPQAAFVASVIVAALALLIDWLAGVAERLVGGRIA